MSSTRELVGVVFVVLLCLLMTSRGIRNLRGLTKAEPINPLFGPVFELLRSRYERTRTTEEMNSSQTTYLRFEAMWAIVSGVALLLIILGLFLYNR